MISPTTFKFVSVFCITALGCSLYAGPVAYAENAYTIQAPQELIDRVEHAAQLLNFTTEYEVVIPKKPGIQINPWNKFITAAIDTETNLPFLLINQEWFAQLPEDEQDFWLLRNITRLQKGVNPLPVKALPYLYSLVSLILILLVLLALRHTALSTKPLWLRLIMAAAFTIGCEVAFMDKIYAKLLSHLVHKYDTDVNELVIAKTGNRDAAIRALQHMNTDINQAFNDGEIFFSPHTKLFADLAELISLPSA